VELPSVTSDPRDFVHDSYLASYEVDCERREIRIHASYPHEGQEPIRTDIVFTDVQAYHFEHDAFGNIIFEFDEIPAGDLYPAAVRLHQRVLSRFRIARPVGRDIGESARSSRAAPGQRFCPRFILRNARLDSRSADRVHSHMTPLRLTNR
jgi:hypothetical protein